MGGVVCQRLVSYAEASTAADPGQHQAMRGGVARLSVEIMRSRNRAVADGCQARSLCSVQAARGQGREGYLDPEAAAWPGQGGQGGAVSVGDGLDDGQAETEAPPLSGAVGTEPPEGLQGPVGFGRWYLRPAGGHR